MDVTVEIDERDVFARLDKIMPDVRDALRDALGPLADEIASDARGLALDHIHSLGAKNPGGYLGSIYGGISEKDSKLVGFVRSGHPLAHLLEYGFTIKDMMITTSAGDVMAFEGSAGEVFTRSVHRHATQVPAYPAIGPALKDKAGVVQDAIAEAVRGAAAGE